MASGTALGFASLYGQLPWRRNVTLRQSSTYCCPRMTSSSTSLSTPPVVAPDEWDIRLKSPCKINLFLRILGKRKDGFHELASLFQAVSLHDTLDVSLIAAGREDTLLCATPGVPTDGSNLVLQAFDKFRERTGITARFRARLEKRVPHAAGLGGGSGNAATALWAANKLTGSRLSDTELAEIGAGFGSDIPFFFTNGSAYCTGRGDRMMEIERLTPQTVYIVKPVEVLSTREVFSALDVESCKMGKDPRELLDKMKKGVIFADFVNDLEQPSFALLPRLATIKRELYKAGFNVVMMTGSGTAFFCLGHPTQKDFHDVFPAMFDVKVMPCMFVSRRFPGKWYFEQPPLSELGEDKFKDKYPIL